MECTILITDNHGETIGRYTASEMRELYTPAERDLLARGEHVVKTHRYGETTHVDLLAFYKARA